MGNKQAKTERRRQQEGASSVPVKRGGSGKSNGALLRRRHHHPQQPKNKQDSNAEGQANTTTTEPQDEDGIMYDATPPAVGDPPEVGNNNDTQHVNQPQDRNSARVPGRAEAFTQLLRTNNIEELTLNGNDINLEGAKAIADALKANSSLRELRIFLGHLFDIEILKAVSGSLKENNTIQELTLCETEIGPEGGKAVAGALKCNNSLKKVFLSANQLGVEGGKALADALKVNNSLRELYISDNVLGPDGGKAIGEALLVNSSLQELGLAGAKVGLVGATALAIALRVNTSLKGLNLGSNDLGTDGAEALANALKVNTTLQTLKIAHNKIGLAGARAIADVLKPYSRGRRFKSSLQCLDLGYENKIGDEGAKAIADALRVNTTLRVLSIEYNEIGPDGVRALAAALKLNTTLQTLDLMFNKIGPDAAKALGDALKVNNTLQILNLESTKIDCDGVIALASVLKVNTSLQRLFIGSVRIGLEGAKSIADAIKVNQSLQQLDLANTDIGPEGMEAIAHALEVNTALQSLNVLGEFWWTDIGTQGVKAIAEALKVTKNLQILGINLSTAGAEGVKAIADALKDNPNVESFSGSSRILEFRLKNRKTCVTEDCPFYSIPDQLLCGGCLLRDKEEKVRQRIQEIAEKQHPEFSTNVVRMLPIIFHSDHRCPDHLLDVCVRNVGIFLQVQELETIRNDYDQCYFSIRKRNRVELEQLQESASPFNKTAEQPRDLLSLEALYEAAEKCTQEFNEFIDVLDHELSSTVSGVHLSKGPMKSKERAIEKISNDYRGQSYRLVDVHRASCICKSLTQIMQTISIVKSNFDVAKIKNTFFGDSTPGGYRDVKLLVRLPLSHFVVELQLHHEELYNLKTDGGHHAYTWARVQPVNDEIDPLSDLIPEKDRTDYILLQMLNVVALRSFQGTELRLFYEMYMRTRMKLAKAIVDGFSEESTKSFEENQHYEKLLFEQGRYYEAEKVCTTCLEIATSRFGKDHPKTLKIYFRLGNYLEMQHHFEKAMKVYRECFEARITVLPPSHPDTIEAAKKYGYLLRLLKSSTPVEDDPINWIALLQADGTEEETEEAALKLGDLAARDAERISVSGGIDALSDLLLKGVAVDAVKSTLMKISEQSSQCARQIADLTGIISQEHIQRVGTELKEPHGSDVYLRAVGEVLRLSNRHTHQFLWALVRSLLQNQFEDFQRIVTILSADLQSQIVSYLYLGGNAELQSVFLHLSSQETIIEEVRARVTNVLGQDVVTKLLDGVTAIDLSCKKLGLEGANILAGALMFNCSLQDINLEDNELGPGGAKALAQMLMVNTTLRTLQMKSNGVGNEGAKAIADALKASPPGRMVNSSLQHLNLDRNEIGSEGARALADALRVNSSLQSISLGLNDVGFEGAKAIALALKSNTSLQRLDLAYNKDIAGHKIGPNGANVFAEVLKTNKGLKFLGLELSKIGDDGAKAMADMLKVNTTLRELNLQYNHIGSEGAKALADALQVNTGLTKGVYLGMNPIDSEGENALREFHSSTKSSNELCLS